MIFLTCKRGIAVVCIAAILGTMPVFALPNTASNPASNAGTASGSVSSASSQTSSNASNTSEVISGSVPTDTTPTSSTTSAPESSENILSSEITDNSVVTSENYNTSSKQTSSKRTDQNTASISSEWTTKLNDILNNACDWLKNKDRGNMYFVALGGAGKSADTRKYVMLMNEISKTVTYTDLYLLATNALNATFCGISASNVQGTDLISQISAFPEAEKSRTKALAYALIALDSNEYTIPTQSLLNRTVLFQYLLSRQQKNGSFAASDSVDNTLETTGLALTALSQYGNDEIVQSALKKGVEYLQNLQSSQKSSSVFLNEDCNTVSQIIIALNSLKINVDDARFINNRKSLDQILLAFLGSDGGFKKNISDKQSDLEATELAVIALTSIKYCANPYLLKQSVPDSSSSSSAAADRFSTSFPFIWLIIVLSILVLAAACVAVLIWRKKMFKNNSCQSQPPDPDKDSDQNQTK